MVLARAVAHGAYGRSNNNNVASSINNSISILGTSPTDIVHHCHFAANV